MEWITIILILHVFGAAIVMAVAFFALILIFHQPIDQRRSGIYHFMARFGMAASIWQLLTGVVLYLHEPSTFNHRTLFWVKIGLYVIEGMMVSLFIDKRVKQAWNKANGQTLAPIAGLPMTVLAWAIVIFAIAAIGVVLVES